MKTGTLLVAASVLLGAGCGGVQQPQTAFEGPTREAARVVPSVGEEAPVEAPTMIVERYRVPEPNEAVEEERAPEEVLADAREIATQSPDEDGFFNSIMEFTYEPGGLYQVYCTPERLTDVALAPGESLVSMAAGDTIRWMLGETSAGSGGEHRVHILIKPVRAGISTNLVITTDRRVYLIELEAIDDGYMAAVAWRYPGQVELVATSTADTNEGGTTELATDPTELDFSFGFVAPRRHLPRWMPVQAFSDGRQTYIQFPRDVVNTTAPAVFLLDSQGETTVVNYRVSGEYYVLDQVIERAELRLGEEWIGVEHLGNERRRR